MLKSQTLTLEPAQGKVHQLLLLLAELHIGCEVKVTFGYDCFHGRALCSAPDRGSVRQEQQTQHCDEGESLSCDCHAPVFRGHG